MPSLLPSLGRRHTLAGIVKYQPGHEMAKTRYDDGGFSGGSTERPALQDLLKDIQARKVDVIVVYKVDRLTRSLADFAKLVELFDAHGVSFASVTQQFNTMTSMGRLTLNVLLSFAQFEREVTSERIRDKVAASKKKGIWVGGPLSLGYAVEDGKIAVLPEPHAPQSRPASMRLAKEMENPVSSEFQLISYLYTDQYYGDYNFAIAKAPPS